MLEDVDAGLPYAFGGLATPACIELVDGLKGLIKFREDVLSHLSSLAIKFDNILARMPYATV